MTTKRSIAELEHLALRMRRNTVDICMQRGGYAGQGVALADVGACLYFHEMKPDGNGGFFDRFVNSNGHDAIMDYSAFAELGLYSIEDLRSYNADGTKVDMSPCEGQRGFEITMGSLGQGPSQSAGIAYGERLRGSGKRVYCLLSDGELQEGNVWEAAMFAGHHKLGNLVWLIDNNDLQAGGATHSILSVEPVPEKFAAFGFATRRINGNSIPEILSAFDFARSVDDKPTAIVCDTKLFSGCDYLQGKFPMAHYLHADPEDWQRGLDELDAKLAASSEVEMAN
ncbi:transketolase [Vannielia litorea]|uniref:Transketolase n=1 Tax=Vannielia litorea TaxID=1217970 RepID=A0A1N6GTG9_9RHOB|nr:thiamine pyrophosphate-dependent enzyme [Vannielia litorea]SIO10891.1 transketolase [Vannielia litorea]